MSQQRNEPEVLAQRLDQVLPPGKKSVPSTLPDPFINTAVLLARTEVPSLDARASLRIESRMLEAFNAQHALRLPMRSRRAAPLLRWALVASLAIILLIVGLSPAVAASLPGEPLYSVKQFYEKIELAAATTPPARASVYLRHADRRTQEALTLLERKQFAPELVSAALADIDSATQLETEVRASPRLRWQLHQVETTLSFIIQDATQSGIVSQLDVAPLSNQIEQYAQSDLLLPPAMPESPPAPVILLTNTPVPSALGTETPTLTETPVPVPTATEEEALTEVMENTPPSQTPPGLVATPACQSRGNSCNSQGVPGGQVISPTHRPTNTPRNLPAPPENNGNSGNNSNGNSAGNGDSNGNNGNGGGASNSSGNNSSNNGNSAGNGNSGGNNSNGNNNSGNGNGKS